jgi:hypothetical protein
MTPQSTPETTLQPTPEPGLSSAVLDTPLPLPPTAGLQQGSGVAGADGVFVSREHLSAWREQMGVITISLSRVQSHLMVGKPNRAQHLLDLLHAATLHMGIALEIAGAPSASADSADSLAQTPDELLVSGANRRLAKALHQAVEAAQAVDAERGRGASDLSEVLRHFAQRVEAEIAQTKSAKGSKKAASPKPDKKDKKAARNSKSRTRPCPAA